MTTSDIVVAGVVASSAETSSSGRRNLDLSLWRGFLGAVPTAAKGRYSAPISALLRDASFAVRT